MAAQKGKDLLLKVDADGAGSCRGEEPGGDALVHKDPRDVGTRREERPAASNHSK